jgi:hypothetical protein
MWKSRTIGLMFVVSVLFGCQLWPWNKIPEELIGEWETTEPRYHNRMLKITKDGIVFFTAPDYMDVNIITGVKTIQENGETLYEIHYRNSQRQKYKLSVYMISNPKGNAIRFKNQPKFEWTKRVK